MSQAADYTQTSSKYGDSNNNEDGNDGDDTNEIKVVIDTSGRDGNSKEELTKVQSVSVSGGNSPMGDSDYDLDLKGIQDGGQSPEVQLAVSIATSSNKNGTIQSTSKLVYSGENGFDKGVDDGVNNGGVSDGVNNGVTGGVNSGLINGTDDGSGKVESLTNLTSMTLVFDDKRKAFYNLNKMSVDGAKDFLVRLYPKYGSSSETFYHYSQEYLNDYFSILKTGSSGSSSNSSNNNDTGNNDNNINYNGKYVNDEIEKYVECFRPRTEKQLLCQLQWCILYELNRIKEYSRAIGGLLSQTNRTRSANKLSWMSIETEDKRQEFYQQLTLDQLQPLLKESFGVDVTCLELQDIDGIDKLSSSNHEINKTAHIELIMALEKPYPQKFVGNSRPAEPNITIEYTDEPRMTIDKWVDHGDVMTGTFRDEIYSNLSRYLDFQKNFRSRKMSKCTEHDVQKMIWEQHNKYYVRQFFMRKLGRVTGICLLVDIVLLCLWIAVGSLTKISSYNIYYESFLILLVISPVVWLRHLLAIQPIYSQEMQIFNKMFKCVLYPLLCVVCCPFILCLLAVKDSESFRPLLLGLFGCGAVAGIVVLMVVFWETISSVLIIIVVVIILLCIVCGGGSTGILGGCGCK